MRLSLRLTLVALLTLLTWGGQVNARTITFDPTSDGVTSGKVVKDGITFSTTTAYNTAASITIEADKGGTTSYKVNDRTLITPGEGITLKKITFYYGENFVSPSGSTHQYCYVSGTFPYYGQIQNDNDQHIGVWTAPQTGATAGNADGDAGFAKFNSSSSDGVYLTKIVVEDDREDEQPISSVTAPTISIATGTNEFAGSTTVTITADEGANIYYTLDGSDPTTSSTKYTAPFEITKTTTVRAIAEVNGELSNITRAQFTNTVINVPVITSSAPYSSSSTITITADEGVDIYYATSDQEKSSWSASDIKNYYGYKYSAPITISGTTYVYAVAYVGSNHSEIASEKFPKEVQMETKTIAELASEGQNYEAVNVKLTNATVAYSNFDEDTPRWIIREDGKAITIAGNDAWQGFTQGDEASGTIALKVTYSDGFLNGYEIDGTTDFSKLTKTQTENEYHSVSGATLTSLSDIANYKGDYVTVNGVTVTRNGDAVTTTYNGATISLSVRGGYHSDYDYWSRDNLNKFEDGKEQVYNIKVWFAGISADGTPDFVIDDATNVSPATVTIQDVRYATFYYDRAFKVPEGVTAKTYTLDDKTLKLTETRTYTSDGEYPVIPSYTAVVLNGEPGTYDFEVADEPSYNGVSNSLRGVLSDQIVGADSWSLENEYFYALQLKKGSTDPSTIGFYWYNEDGKGGFTMPAHKAYLEVYKNQDSNGKGFALNGDDTETTGIQSVISASASELNVNAPMYNLAGQRVGKSFKGIVIQNGKKFVVK